MAFTDKEFEILKSDAENMNGWINIHVEKVKKNNRSHGSGRGLYS